MRRLLSCVPAGLLLIALAGPTGSVTWADPARRTPRRRCRPPPSRRRRIPRVALEHGLNLERARNWAGGHRGLSHRARALAQPRRFQPPAAALRDPLQALAPLSRYEFPERAAPLAARAGRRSLRRGRGTHPDQLCRPRAARAAGPPWTRQPRGGPARPGLRQDQRAGRHAPSGWTGCATPSVSTAPS